MTHQEPIEDAAELMRMLSRALNKEVWEYSIHRLALSESETDDEYEALRHASKAIGRMEILWKFKERWNPHHARAWEAFRVDAQMGGELRTILDEIGESSPPAVIAACIAQHRSTFDALRGWAEAVIWAGKSEGGG